MNFINSNHRCHVRGTNSTICHAIWMPSIAQKNRPLSETHPCEKVDDEEEKLWDVDAALGARRGAHRGGRPPSIGAGEWDGECPLNGGWGGSYHYQTQSRMIHSTLVKNFLEEELKGGRALTFLSRHSQSRLGWRSKSVASSPSSLIYRNGIVSCLFKKCQSIPFLN